MSQISDAFRSFFLILFKGELPADIARTYGFVRATASGAATGATTAATTGATPFATTGATNAGTGAAATQPKAIAGPADGAIQILSILQRDARLVDFVMEDISGYSDDQVGAAVRDVQAQSRQALERYLKLIPVIDGVEGDFTKTEGVGAKSIRLVGNVPANGKASGGVLRHKGWKAEKIDLPAVSPGAVLAPAEIEVE